MADEVLRERRGHVEILTINRPAARNAINLAVATALSAALDDCEADDDCWVVVLTGAEDKAFSAAARSLVAVARHRRRYYALMRRIRVPVLLVHGTHDRMVSRTAADKVAEANPDWEYLLLDGVGHTPQMEVPGRFADGVLGWLAGIDVLPAG